MKKNCLRLLIVGLIVFTSFPCLLAQEMTWILPLGQILTINPSIRSHGMASTGVADTYDATTSYLNPAAASFLKGIYLNGGYAELLPDLVKDGYTINIGAAGGMLLFQNNSYDLMLGGCMRYNLLDMGEQEWVDSENNTYTVHSKEHNINLSLAASANIANTMKVGLGLSVKPLWSTGFRNEQINSDDYVKLAYDIGFMVRSTVIERGGYSLTPSFGISSLNLGGEIDATGPDRPTEFKRPLPRKLRYGFGLRFVSPSYAPYDEIMGRELPVCIVTALFDVLDERREEYSDFKNIYSSGIEVGLMQLLFLRYGYIDNEDDYIEDSTFGVGIGSKYKNYEIRMDYANVPQSGDLDRVNKFGFSLGTLF